MQNSQENSYTRLIFLLLAYNWFIILSYAEAAATLLKKGHLEILASASRHWYRHSNINIIAHFKLSLELKVSSLCTIYSKQVIFSKVTTSCIKGITVKPRRNFSEILKRGTWENSCQKTPVMESVFNKITEMDSRPALFLKRNFHPGHFPVNISEFSALFQLWFW